MGAWLGSPPVHAEVPVHRALPRGIVRAQDEAEVIPRIPERPPSGAIPAELTLAPAHLLYEYDSGNFVACDPTMPYSNHWDMVEPLSEEEFLDEED